MRFFLCLKLHGHKCKLRKEDQGDHARHNILLGKLTGEHSDQNVCDTADADTGKRRFNGTGLEQC